MAPVRRRGRGSARVTWLDELHAELGRAGIRGRTRSPDRARARRPPRVGSGVRVAARFAARGRGAASPPSFAGREPAAPRGISFCALALAGLGLRRDLAGLCRRGWLAERRRCPRRPRGAHRSRDPRFLPGRVRRRRARDRPDIQDPAAGRRRRPRSFASSSGRMSVAIVAAGLTCRSPARPCGRRSGGRCPAWWDAVALVSAALPLRGARCRASTVGSTHARSRPTGGAPAAGLVARSARLARARGRAPVLGRPWLARGAASAPASAS